MEYEVIYDSVAIQKILPHRYPLLLVDKVVEMVDNERIVAIKAVTINEPFFPGHFPHRPIMPGVLILEAMAQTAAILAHRSSDGVQEGKMVVLTGVDKAKWKRQVVPGDLLRIEMTTLRRRRPIWVMAGEAIVDGKVVATAELSAAEVPVGG